MTNKLCNMFLDLLVLVLGALFLSSLDLYYPRIADGVIGGMWGFIVVNRTWLRWRCNYVK